MREWFLQRERLEVDIRGQFGKSSVLFPESLDGLRTETTIRYRSRECLLLLLIVRTEDGVLIQEGLIGWTETDKRTGEVLSSHKQLVTVAELRSAQRHGGQSDEVAA
jgi:hypothetical protein